MWKLAILIVAVIFGKFSVNCQKLIPYVECNGVNKMTLEVIFRYFEDQHFMTIIDSTNQHSLDIYVCVGVEFYRPWDVYNDFKEVDFTQATDTSSVTSFATIHGYFVKASLEEISDEFFEKLSKQNPKTKLLINVDKLGVEESKEIIQNAYDKFKMLNVATISHVLEFEDEKLVGVTIVFCLYNPFSGSKEERNPEFQCWDITSDNVQQFFTEMQDFLRMRVKNLQGYPLKISIFEHEMVSLPINDEEGELVSFTYPDGEITSALARCMNFTPVYEQLFDGGPKYGFQDSDGTFLGSLGELEYGKVDLAANARLIANYNTSESVFLQPITMMKLFFVVQKRVVNKNLMVAMFTELDFYSKILSIILVVLFPLSFIWIHNFEKKIQGKKAHVDVVKSILDIHGIVNGISVNHPSTTASRIVFTTIFFWTIMSSSVYQGVIVKDLNSDRNIGRIRKIDTLLQQNFKIGMAPSLTYAFQSEGDDKVSRALNKMTRNFGDVALPPESATYVLLENDKFAYLWSDLFAGSYLNRYYDETTGENSFEVVPESAFQFYIAMMAPKSSPFIESMNEVINIYVQSGLFQHDTQQPQNDNDKIWIYRVINDLVPKEKSKSLTIADLQNVFKLYLGLIVLSFFVFFIEALTNLRKSR